MESRIRSIWNLPVVHTIRLCMARSHRKTAASRFRGWGICTARPTAEKAFCSAIPSEARNLSWVQLAEKKARFLAPLGTTERFWDSFRGLLRGGGRLNALPYRYERRGGVRHDLFLSQCGEFAGALQNAAIDHDRIDVGGLDG